MHWLSCFLNEILEIAFLTPPIAKMKSIPTTLQDAMPESLRNLDLQKGLAAFEAKVYAQAIALLRAFAERGHPEAQCLMGYMYHLGLGVARAHPKSFMTDSQKIPNLLTLRPTGYTISTTAVYSMAKARLQTAASPKELRTLGA
jgi:hypothetical protein